METVHHPSSVLHAAWMKRAPRPAGRGRPLRSRDRPWSRCLEPSSAHQSGCCAIAAPPAPQHRASGGVDISVMISVLDLAQKLCKHSLFCTKQEKYTTVATRLARSILGICLLPAQADASSSAPLRMQRLHAIANASPPRPAGLAANRHRPPPPVSRSAACCRRRFPDAQPLPDPTLLSVRRRQC